MAKNGKQQLTQLSGVEWGEELLTLHNLFATYQEFDDLDGMARVFTTLLDAAYGLVVTSHLDAPLRAPWQPSEVYARGGER